MSEKDLAGLLMLLLLQFTLKQDHTSTGSCILAAKYFAEMKEKKQCATETKNTTHTYVLLVLYIGCREGYGVETIH